MPTIRVDQEVFEGLQKLAQPFVDTPGAVIRRLLEAQGALKKKADAPRILRPRLDALTPQSVYENYLLTVLATEFDGRGSKRDVTHAVLYALDAQTGAELYTSGEAIDSWNHYGSLALTRGRLYLSTYDARVYVFGLE